MYLLLTTPVALFLLIYGIYKWLKRQSEREKEFWNEQKIYGHPVSLKIYGWLKAVLVLIILGGIMLILVSLAYGQELQKALVFRFARLFHAGKRAAELRGAL